jgi:hypothetical protein
METEETPAIKSGGEALAESIVQDDEPIQCAAVTNYDLEGHDSSKRDTPL